MKPFILLFLVTISSNLYCQLDSLNDNEKLFTVVEEMPVFLNGGEKGLLKIITDSVVYPVTALKDNVGGKVKVEFTIDTTGGITNVRILKGIREDIDNEAIRVVSLLNGWRPGYQNGKKVTVVYAIPVGFWPNPKFKKKYLKNESKGKLN